ncbi:MAG: hypothetical protein M1838_003733 [Thelocarpon superellum]|nr:MAG: hypothetical protein M1838_003733 [Thelocarpon superellum]
MTSAKTDVSRDRDDGPSVRHQHSSSELSRTPVPISDPERAPPPLPLNPSSPSLTTHAHASPTVVAAAAALTERTREHAGPSHYMTNPMAVKRDGSPDKSLIKGHHHKRMQSLQVAGGSVRDMSHVLEQGTLRSPERSPERSTSRAITPGATREVGSASPERNPHSSALSLYQGRESGRDTPSTRSSSTRPPPKSILGENTPPQSATMLALQTMSTPTKGESPGPGPAAAAALGRTPQSFDGISSQILSLTSIATSLQREMTQLSRRSRDNATDLISLKEATNARDEDIRKSLRDLVHTLSATSTRGNLDMGPAGPYLLDDKPHAPSPPARAGKNVTLPRIPTPSSFAASLERELGSGSSSYSADASATLALLEKVLREMGTRDGQDRLVSLIGDLTKHTTKDDAKTSEKLEEIVTLLRERSNSLALVAHPGGGNGGVGETGSPLAGTPPRGPQRLDFDYTSRRPSATANVHNALASRTNRGGAPSQLAENRKPYSVPGAAELVGDDITKLLRRLKDSVTENGGMTAEVKALVRELRGEVLGMGREIGRKLNEANTTDDKHKARDGSWARDDVARIMQEGLAELKDHMERAMREKRRQSASSMVSRNTVDSQEVYEAVRQAMSDLQMQQQSHGKGQVPALDKEDIIEAVKDAWETYKPEIELQNFGLEREEVLQCLKEGLEEYRPIRGSRDASGASRDEVLEAIREGLEQFQPPPPVPLESEASVTREEILGTVRECLETFDFAKHVASATRDIRASRLSAGGLNEPAPKGFGGVMEEMRMEFQAVSDEAKQNVAAHGRDTEQVLDAVKDGLERLRSDVELYVDRAADVTGKDEIIESLRDGFELLRMDMQTLGGRDSTGSSSAVMEEMKAEFEHLRGIIATTIVKSGSSADKDEILDALAQGFDELRADVGKPHDRPESILSGTGEILDALNDGLESLRADVADMAKKPAEAPLGDEILDTLKTGLASVRADLDRLHVGRDLARQLGPEGGQMVVAENLKRNDIENLEVLITQLRIKVEALDAMSRDPPPPPPGPRAGEDGITKDDLAAFETLLKNIQSDMAELAGREHDQCEATAKKDDIDAIETLLINTKAKIDDMVLPNAESAAKHEHVEAVEFLVRETKEAVEDFSARVDAESVKKDDMGVMESLLKELIVGLEEVKERAAAEAESTERVTKTDLDALEELCADTKIQLEQIQLPDPATLPTKADLDSLEAILVRFREKVQLDAEGHAQAQEERRAETEGLMERLGEVKGFLNGLKDDIRAKFDDGSASLDVIGKLLEGVGETVGANATVTADVKEVMETLMREFERSHGLGEGLKLDHEHKASEMLHKLDERFDEMMTKYDDAQLAADAKAQAAEEQATHKDEMLAGTRAVAEELKLLIDTLGATITDSADKMVEDSKTVFNRVEDTHAKVEEVQLEERAEHRQTRDEVQKVTAAVGGMRGELDEHQPKMLTSIKDILLIVSQHYEYAQRQATEEKARIRAASQPPAPTQPVISDVPPVKYDDTEVHAKLDKLVNHANAAGKSFAQIDLLEQIHGQVVTTAAEMSEFVAAQAKLITEDHEDKEKQAEEASLALERRLAQKERAEADIARLNEEKEQLQEVVDDLGEEKEDLMSQKMKLSADVASLETALRLRQEELVTMEARAEGLERRILEGVIDHSRALIMARPGQDPSSNMSLKRVPSHASSKASSVRQSGLGMALRTRPPPIRLNAAGGTGSGRRILSLNEITGNLPTGAKGPGHGASHTTDRGVDHLKRSHSVRTTTSSVGVGVGAIMGLGRSSRKSSWGGRTGVESELYDKENDSFTDESVDDESDAGTERRRPSFSTHQRSSYGTISGTLGTESTIDEAEEERALSGELERGSSNGHARGRLVIYDGAADSGVGDELATADLQGDGIVWGQ